MLFNEVSLRTRTLTEKTMEGKAAQKLSETPVSARNIQSTTPFRTQKSPAPTVDQVVCPRTARNPKLHSFSLLTNSMEQSPSWEAKRFSASQEIPRILWNPKVH